MYISLLVRHCMCDERLLRYQEPENDVFNINYKVFLRMINSGLFIVYALKLMASTCTCCTTARTTARTSSMLLLLLHQHQHLYLVAGVQLVRGGRVTQGAASAGADARRLRRRAAPRVRPARRAARGAGGARPDGARFEAGVLCERVALPQGDRQEHRTHREHLRRCASLTYWHL